MDSIDSEINERVSEINHTSGGQRTVAVLYTLVFLGLAAIRAPSLSHIAEAMLIGFLGHIAHTSVLIKTSGIFKGLLELYREYPDDSFLRHLSPWEEWINESEQWTIRKGLQALCVFLEVLPFLLLVPYVWMDMPLWQWPILWYLGLFIFVGLGGAITVFIHYEHGRLLNQTRENAEEEFDQRYGYQQRSA